MPSSGANKRGLRIDPIDLRLNLNIRFGEFRDEGAPRAIFMLLISAHSAARSRRSRRSRPRNRVHTTRARRLVETGLTSTATAHQHEVLWVYRPLLQPPSRCRPRRRQPPRRNRTDHRSTVGRPPALPAIDARLDLQIDDAIVEHRVKGDAAREAACAAATRRRCRRRCIHLVLVGNRLWRRGRYRRRMDARCCEVGCVDGRLLGRLLRLPFPLLLLVVHRRSYCERSRPRS